MQINICQKEVITSVALLEAGHTVIVADNLCNSKAETIHNSHYSTHIMEYVQWTVA